MKAIVIDLETTMRRKDGFFSADPFFENNKILCVGWKEYRDGDDGKTHVAFEPTTIIGELIDSDCNVIVGHNIRFDLNYMLRYVDKDTRNRFWKTKFVWDTMQAEYILTGARERTGAKIAGGYSLDATAEKYGMKKMDTLMVIGGDITTEDIDPLELMKYCSHDVDITYQIFLKQLKQFSEEKGRKYPTLFKWMCRAQKATLRMQNNGLAVDLKKCNEILDVLRNVMDENAREWKAYVISRADDPEFIDYLLDTDAEELCLKRRILEGLFMTKPVKWKKSAPVLDEDGEPVVYKSGLRVGELKYKNVDMLSTFVPAHHPATDSVDEAFIVSAKAQVPELEHLLAFRKAHKMSNTYIKPLASRSLAHMKHGMGFIHANYNHCQTATGRLSSSDPNMQNISSEEMFGVRPASVIIPRDTSRHFIRIDYDQLEVWALAILSNDAVLKDELLSGVDIHRRNAEDHFRSAVTEAQRKQIKAMTFQLQYGVSAGGLAYQWGMQKKEAQEFINAYYSKYKGIATYHSMLLDNENFEYLGDFNYRYHSITGRMYTFKDLPKKGGKWTKDAGAISPVKPQRYNYPVQGFATADVVPIALALVSEYINAHCGDEVLLINTTHDSIDLEVVGNKALKQRTADILELMTGGVMGVLKDSFGIDIDVPLKVSMETGFNLAFK